MKLPIAEHVARPWRIHEIALDFRVEDVWALDTPGGPDDFPKLVDTIRSMEPGDSSPAELPFVPLYMTHDEAAAEIANHTMHGVLHLGWVPRGDGAYRGQMAVLVKRNGRLGAAYMAAIA